MPVVEVVRTYLEMSHPTRLTGAAPLPVGATVRREACTTERYRRLYADVGRAHHWRDREAWSDAALAEYLANPGISVWVLRVDNVEAGYFELRAHDDGSGEIAVFGLTAPFHGRGLGRALLVRAVEEAWRLGPTRIWLHTCTLDHAAALPNYLARGFTPYRTERYTVDLPAA